ncbi:transposase domain-containing protein [Salinarimonas chemoclinalis]|uniref:transposase domain-containing protein n=1 Tax=Salinarimonas chemoclinalis TaxID=3241599 RepID=UPI00355680F6
MPFEVYMHATPSQRAEADRRRAMCADLASRIEAGESKQDAYAAVAVVFDVSVSTVRNAWRCVRDLHPAHWLPALVKGYRGREAEEVHPDVLRYFFSDYGRQEAPQLQAVYERTVRAAAHKGWGPVPSAKTLKRRFEVLPAAVKVRLREGDKAADAMYPHQERDRSGLKPLDGLNMDSRIWDIRVELPDGRIIRPVITLAQDEASNLLLGYEVTETESSHSYRRVLCSIFETFGIYKAARFDNTRAAANKALTAGAKKRFRFTDRPDDIEGILPRVGCTPRFTLPYNGRSKLIERGFAEVKERTEKHPALAGCYTGKSPAHKPENYGSRAVPLATFEAILREGIEHYNTRRDRASAVAFKRSHRDVFEEGLASVQVPKLTAAQKRYFFSIAERRTVTPSGSVKLGKAPHVNRYFASELQDHAGREVVVWYNPDDLASPLLVETLDGRLISDRVPLLEKGGFASADAARQYARGRRQARKAERDRIAALKLMSDAERAEALPPIVPLTAPEASVVRPATGFGRSPKREGAPAPAMSAAPDHDFHKLLAIGARKVQAERERGRLAG